MSESVVPVQEPVDNQKEYNFSQLRKQVEQERHARITAEEKIAQFEKLSQYKPLDEEEDDEPYVDKKKLKKVLNQFGDETKKSTADIVRNEVEKALNQERTSQYLRENNDFEQVMNSDLVQKFADAHPKLAEIILRMPEGFERQKLVYENIKAAGIDRPQPKQQSIQEKIDANRRSPFMPSGGPGSAPYAQVGDFSPVGQKNAYDAMKAKISQLRL